MCPKASVFEANPGSIVISPTAKCRFNPTHKAQFPLVVAYGKLEIATVSYSSSLET